MFYIEIWQGPQQGLNYQHIHVVRWRCFSVRCIQAHLGCQVQERSVYVREVVGSISTVAFQRLSIIRLDQGNITSSPAVGIKLVISNACDRAFQ